MKTPTGQHLDILAERIRVLEQRRHHTVGCVATGWPAVDEVLGGGLSRGAVHEWFLGGGEGEEERNAIGCCAVWLHLVIRDQGERSEASGTPEGGGTGGGGGGVVWVGERVWPYPHGLCGGPGGPGIPGVLGGSLFVEVANVADRLWAIDLAARHPGVSMVAADGSGLSMAATRRLQLAAEAAGTLVLLARPMSDRTLLSAAATRWLLTPMVSETERPAWLLEQLRCKGVRRGIDMEGQRKWRLEGMRNRGKGFVVVHADAVDRPSPAQTSAPGEARRRA